MNDVTILLSLCIALLLGAISPGPSFFTIVQISITQSRKHGIASALGMGTGASIFSILAVCGLEKIFILVPKLYVLLKFLGAIYLLWLALKTFKNRNIKIEMNIQDREKTSLISSYRSGLLTQISNPKTAIILASTFTALLPKTIPEYYYIAVPLLCFLINTGWYSCVSLLLSSPKPREVYIKFKKFFDCAVSGVLSILAFKLIFSEK